MSGIQHLSLLDLTNSTGLKTQAQQLAQLHQQQQQRHLQQLHGQQIRQQQQQHAVQQQHQLNIKLNFLKEIADLIFQ